jgi:aminomethyltransferase
MKSFLNSSAEFRNISLETAKLDLQGPLSRDALSAVTGGKTGTLKYYSFNKFGIAGDKALISRTGYTGELGYEIYINSGKADELWGLLLSDQRVKPAGLGARDILRIEAGYSLYGHDIGEWTDPVEAGLESFVDYTKDFMGKKALLKRKESGVGKRKISFRTNTRRSPRQGYDITFEGAPVGNVTSGIFSPSLSVGIGLGYVRAEYSKIGEKLLIKHENIEIEAEITGLPFYKNGTLRI